jgi:hypothetical protein
MLAERQFYGLVDLADSSIFPETLSSNAISWTLSIVSRFNS